MDMKPTWDEFPKKESYPKLEGDLVVDIAVVGGGMAGILCAYMLCLAGKKVAVLESEELGSGASGLTTAFLTSIIDTSQKNLISMFGIDRTRKIYESGQEAIKTYEEIIDREGIECEFMRCTNHIYANSKTDFKELEKEYVSFQYINAEVELQKKNDLGFRNEGCIAVHEQAKFHPRKFLLRLAQKISKAGVRIFEHTKALAIHEAEQQEIITEHGILKAGHVIIATYSPFANPLQTFLKKGMYVTYVFEIQIPKGILADALFEDTANPYHYFRVDKGKEYDRMIIGGEDHRVEIKMDQEKMFRGLERYVRRILKGIPYVMTRRWTGPILEPSDGLALIGPLKQNQWVATAFSGNGMTYSMIASILLRDLILKNEHPWAKIYDPLRIPNVYQIFKKGIDYTGELVGGAVKNKFGRHI